MGPHRARGWRSYDLVGIFGPVLPAKRRFLAKGKRNGPPCFALDTVDLSLKDFRSTQRVDTWD